MAKSGARSCGVARKAPHYAIRARTRVWLHAGYKALMRRGVLAPDAERFLRRAVGDREQHRVLRGVVGVVLPRRHNEDVPRGPGQLLAVDHGRALAFGADEDGAVGRAVLLALEPS